MAVTDARGDPENTSPTDFFPWLGTSWLLILKTFGLRSGLWALYLVVAARPARSSSRQASGTLRSATEPWPWASSPLSSWLLMAGTTTSPVLFYPAFVLIGVRLSEKAGSLLLLALLVIPYIQFMILQKYSRSIVPNVNFFIECTYFWIPGAVAGAWFATSSVAGGSSIPTSIEGTATVDTPPHVNI